VRQLAKNSKKAYDTYANRFIAWLEGRDPTLELAEAYMDYLTSTGSKQNTIGVAGRAIRRMFSIQVAVPSIEMLEPHYLSVDEVKKMIDVAPTLLEKTILILTFSTACRISEILNLTKDDLELKKGVATVTRKGGQRQRIPLGDQGAAALKTWLKERHSNTQRVFMDYSYNNIYYRLKLVGKKAGVSDFHPHLLRHSRIRHLIEAGVPVERVSEVAGHRKLDTTQKIYGSLRAEERARYLIDF
jgi:integrase/recombinase XerD